MPDALPVGVSGEGTVSRRPAVGWVLTFLVVLGATLGGWIWWKGRPAPVEALPTDVVRLDGRLFLRAATNQTFTGVLVDRHPDGSPKSRSRVVDGLLDGLSEGWHTNGVLQVRERFVAGVADGPVTRWHPGGNRLSEGTARAGKLEGRFRKWHENGVPAEEVFLRAGEPDGVARAWYPSGFPKAEVTVRDGQVVRQEFWNDGERQAGLVAASGKGQR